jgi:protein-tyrosine phosphatase
MIDIHFHCLPGIDDGPKDWDEAVALCRLAGSEGTTLIVATPHVLRDGWVNDNPRAISRMVTELNRRVGGAPKIVNGCEFYYTASLLEMWESPGHGPVITLNRGSHLLVEFPTTTLPTSAEAVFHELVISGITPVIAHPERHAVLTAKPEKLARLVDIGAKCQVTAGSMTGDFGGRVRAAAELLIENGLVHAVASDAHSISRRPPRLALARKAVERKWGDVVAAAMFDREPAAIVASARSLQAVAAV